MSEPRPTRVDSVVKALVLCLDSTTTDQVGEVLRAIGIEMESCGDSQAAIRRLGREKLDALFLDWQERSHAVEVLRFARNSSSDRTIVVFAITAGHSQAEDAFRSGTHFVISRPVSKPQLIRALRSAYGLMLRQRRRYFRYPVVMSVLVSNSSGREVETASFDISERGIAITLPGDAKAGDELALRFRLPGNTDRLCLKAQVCWTDARSRRAGLQFASLPLVCTEELQSWMARRLEQCSPAGNRATNNVPMVV